MSIMKNRDAAFNYGCLMAELKEKMVLFRSRLNKKEEENQDNLIENRCKDEFKIGKDSLISENELDFSINTESNSKNIVHSDRLIKENEAEVMDESGIENGDECRLRLSSDSKIFPYPICFVSKSLPTPPKDYNLRKTGINSNTSKPLESEKIDCNRVSNKLMFLVEERNESDDKHRKFRKENDDSFDLIQNQVFGESLDTENNFVSQSINSQLNHENKTERKVNTNKLNLSQTIKPLQLSDKNNIQKEQVIKTNILIQNSQSMENIRNFEENLISKSKNLNCSKTKPLSCLEKNNSVDASIIDNNNKYKISMNTSTSIDVNTDHSVSEKHTKITSMIKNKNSVSRQRSNIITTRYYKMASQLRVIN